MGGMRVLILTVILTLLCISCGSGGFGTYKSPNSSLIAEVYLDSYRIHLNFQKSGGDAIRTIDTKASDVQKWVVAWVDDSTFVLNSSDIGTYAWKVEVDSVVPIPTNKQIVLAGKMAYRKKYGR
jgi:hypothetical protein